MSRDYMIRSEQTFARRGEAPCKDCGHATSEHRELPRSDPWYQPAVFHCTREGCACVHDRAQA